MFCDRKGRGRARRSFDNALNPESGTHRSLEKRSVRKELVEGCIVSKQIELVTQLFMFISAKSVAAEACASFKMQH